MQEIEELFKNEDLVKNKKLVQAFLDQGAIYKNPKSTPEQKAQALQTLKTLGMDQMKVPKPTKPVAQPISTNPAPTPVKPHIIPKYHPVYQHYGVTPEQWNSAGPDAHQALFEHHNNVMAGKLPQYNHIKTAIEQQMKKSLENVYTLLKAINEEINKSNYGKFKGGSQYNMADNLKRKASRTGDVVGAGPNTAVRSFSTKPGQLSAKQSAAAVERKKKKLSGPVKVYSPEEIKALEAQRTLKKPV